MHGGNCNMKCADILLINPPFHVRHGGGSFLPLGLGYIISSIIVAGYSWDLLDCTKLVHSFYSEDLEKFRASFSKALDAYSPLLIGIGPCITTQLRALEIITDCCREAFPQIPIFAGGPLASIDGQEWLFFDKLGINCIIKGDGELAVLEAITLAKAHKDISNSPLISCRGYSFTNRIENIDEIVYPFRELLSESIFSMRRSGKQQKNHSAAMITSRGCPYSCNYCVSGNLPGTVRKRSNENIISEMEFLQQRYNANDIVFYDDCFFINRVCPDDEIGLFCDKLLEKKLSMTWQVEMRPDMFLALSEISILKLSSAGCRQINIGIEKISKDGLAFLGKPIELAGLKDKIALLKSVSNIRVAATFILGGRNETREDVLELINESISFGLDFAHYNPLFIYPGTPLYSEMFNTPQDWANYIWADEYPWGEIVFENRFLTASDLLDLVDYAYETFYKGSPYAFEHMVTDRFNIKQGKESLY